MEIDFKRIVFTSLDGWLSFTGKAATGLLNGILDVLFALVAAIVSLSYKLWIVFTAFVRRRPLLAVAFVSLVITVVWMAVAMRVAAKSKYYEHQRDSLSYELSKFTQAYTPRDSTIVIADSTYIYCY